MNNIYEDLSIIQIKVLSLIAWVDGEITREEEEFYNNILQISPCSEETKKSLQKWIKQSPKLSEVLDSVTSVSKEIVISVLRNAYAIAATDGNVNDKEMEIIDKISQKLGVKEEHMEALHTWLELSYQVELIETKLFNTKF